MHHYCTLLIPAVHARDAPHLCTFGLKYFWRLAFSPAHILTCCISLTLSPYKGDLLRQRAFLKINIHQFHKEHPNKFQSSNMIFPNIPEQLTCIQMSTQNKYSSHYINRGLHATKACVKESNASSSYFPWYLRPVSLFLVATF